MWQQIYRKVADILVCKGNRGRATEVKGGKNCFVCFNFNQLGRVGCEVETEESKSRVWHGSDPQQSDDRIDHTATHWWSHWSQKWSENWCWSNCQHWSKLWWCRLITLITGPIISDQIGTTADFNSDHIGFSWKVGQSETLVLSFTPLRRSHWMIWKETKIEIKSPQSSFSNASQ